MSVVPVVKVKMAPKRSVGLQKGSWTVGNLPSFSNQISGLSGGEFWLGLGLGFR